MKPSASGRTLPEIHPSTRKHYGRDRLNDELVLEAYAHALRPRPLDDEDDPRRWLVIGLDRSGGPSSSSSSSSMNGSELLIHAMKARSQYLEG